ncbi:hypothetical protein VTK73DRAFT_7760 [Phialemonium thermophilum]|uniref:Peptidase A1 domain-containing protein n=1 Tax=Phialemonium thermophilum TaxID=223376 RepID=A0ABR3XRG1_9PEZI
MAPLSSLVLLTLARTCLSQTLTPLPSIHEGCIHMPIIHSTNPQHFGKRAASVALANRSDIAYYAQLTIGNPGQSVFVQLDTGSFELWVNPDCSDLDGSNARFCQSAGFYDTTKSSTAVSLGTGKTLRYGIGSANITYFRDDIALPGSTTGLKSVQFGVATSTVDEFSGILGIGYGQGIATRYKNFIDELSAQNAVKVKAFTIALGGKDVQEGVIVFGGVDTSRFSGTLTRLPIIPAANSPDNVPRYWIDMQSVRLTAPSGRTRTYANSTLPVFLDSGATMTLLPADLAAAIAADFGATATDSGGFYPVDCDLTKTNGSLDFVFNGVTIQVPYNELIRTIDSTPPSCFLGISQSNDFTLLGDTFMRSVYATFDLDNNVIWMAQAANCGSTPAALANSNVLSTLTGACSTRSAVATSNTGSGVGSNGAAASSAAGSGDPTRPKSTNEPGSVGNGGSVDSSAASAPSSGQFAWGTVAGVLGILTFLEGI